MTTNILSTSLIYCLTPRTLLLTWIVTLIYFMTTPLMGLVYFFYTLANIHEENPRLKQYLLFSAIPGMVYLGFVLANPLTKCLFDLTIEGGYVQGSWISTTYIIFYLYCLACVVFVALQGKRVSPAIRAILFSFPLIAGVVIIIQLIYPTIILSGSAATGAILIIYLFLQNKRISIDYLTHLPNRHEFLKMLGLCLRRKHPCSIVVVSLREFKDVNETHGQQCGDCLLAAISAYLRKSLGLREGEIYRYSGDEFALLLHEGDSAAVKRIVQQVLDRMSRPWEVQKCTCVLSVAIGIVHYPNTSNELTGLINGLDVAVGYAKKASGCFYVCYCTPELLQSAKRRHLIAEELAANTASYGFEIYYQPIFSVQENRFVKAEALLRMPSERLGFVFPDEFIPVAEETGLIIEITYLVLDKVCRLLRSLIDQGIAPENININFSALQFMQKDLIPRMLKIISQHDIPFSKIKVEFTESTLAENTEMVTNCLVQMNETGLRIALDDFGTGYSNLISVLDLPIDAVKLDKSLVWSAMKNERCSIAVQNFARAFRELGMTVLAEGVETEEQREFVVNAGCTLIQGYFYAKPMPEAAFVAFLKEKSAQ